MATSRLPKKTSSPAADATHPPSRSTSTAIKQASYGDAPRRISEILAGPPLLPGEDEAAYFTILEWIAHSVFPEDAFEAIWVKEIADAIWEGERNQRMRASFIETKFYAKAIASVAAKVPHNINTGSKKTTR